MLNRQTVVYSCPPLSDNRRMNDADLGHKDVGQRCQKPCRLVFHMVVADGSKAWEGCGGLWTLARSHMPVLIDYTDASSLAPRLDLQPGRSVNQSEPSALPSSNEPALVESSAWDVGASP